jgi:ankyrin repeat protein
MSCIQETELHTTNDLHVDLIEAIENGDIEAVRKVIKEFDSCGYRVSNLVNARDWEGRTPLYYAILNECTEIAELLKQHGGKL